MKKYFPLYQAKFWQKFYGVRNWVLISNARHGVAFRWLFLVALILASILFLPSLRDELDQYFSVQGRLESFQTVLVTLGSALIGATAIAFSLVMFAMQVNVERMPHGLFRKFASDLRLLAAFSVTFFLAVFVSTLSLIPDSSWVAPATLCAAWAVVLIIVFFLVAYRRALTLISPTEQLSLLLVDTKDSLERWSKAADRAAPLMTKQESSEGEERQLQRV